ncbi:MAG TPA: hypothetical protein VIJ40_00580 [Acidimicrobiales bacterium]
MSIFKRTSILMSSLALASTLFVVGASSVAQASVKNPTASSVLTASAAALKTEIGVHVKVSTTNGKVTTKVTAKIGTVDGTETYVSGAEKFSITVTPTYAYLSGSKTGLVTLMGLTATEQKKVGSSSVAMKKGTAPYTTFKTNLTSGTFSALLPAVKGTTLLAARDKATNGYQLSWVTKATSTAPKSTSVLTISSGKKALPIKEAVTTSTGHSTTSFTKWGKKVTVVAPTKTIAYASVFG